MTSPEPTEAEKRKAEQLAKLFDLRMFVGALFVIFGVMVTIAGLRRQRRRHREGRRGSGSRSGPGW